MNPFIRIDPDGGFLSSDDCHHETIQGLLCYKLGFCGCGIPDKALALVVSFMKTRAFPEDKDLTIPDREQCIELIKLNPEAAAYIIFYLLDHKRLMEHGSSIPGWLTKFGEEFVDHYDGASSA